MDKHNHKNMEEREAAKRLHTDPHQEKHEMATVPGTVRENPPPTKKKRPNKRVRERQRARREAAANGIPRVVFEKKGTPHKIESHTDCSLIQSSETGPSTKCPAAKHCEAKPETTKPAAEPSPVNEAITSSGKKKRRNKKARERERAHAASDISVASRDLNWFCGNGCCE